MVDNNERPDRDHPKKIEIIISSITLYYTVVSPKKCAFR